MSAASKPVQLRETGISVVGRVPWSTHFSLFYETQADLVSVIVPFFKAGLEAGELCVWLPSNAHITKVVREALRAEVPDFDLHVADGDMELIPEGEFYRPTGTFAAAEVLRQWELRTDRVRNEGYAGLRGSGVLDWLGADDWRAFSDFEQTLHVSSLGKPWILLCAYSLGQRQASDVLDSVAAHHFVLARRQGKWDVVETPTLKATKEEIERLNQILENRVAERTRQLARSESYLNEGQRLSHTGSFGVDVTSGKFTYVSAESRRIFGFASDDPLPTRPEFLERIHAEDRAKVTSDIQTSIVERRDTESEFRVVRPDGSIRYLYSTRHPILDDSGRVVELLGTTMDITDRRLAAAKLARARRAAREQALEARFAAALEERTRLAREIHDSLLQGVTGIALQLRATLPRLKDAPAAVTKSISEVVDLAESTIRDARRAVWDMRAPSLVQKGLAKALKEAVHRAAGDVALDFRIAGKARTLPPEAEDTIFRVAREAVINAVKHAAARSIKVTLTYKARSATLAVVDAGRGFRAEQAFRAYAGRWGLLGMRERADRIGAKLTIRSKLGRGTTVELRVPS